jgi:hypothetical protein
MLVGLVLLYVGAVLCVNGMWLLGKVGDNEIGIINVFAGVIAFLVALFLAFGPQADTKTAALVLLFAFTYLWVAYNTFRGADGRGLGWYCLFVAVTAVPVTIETLAGANTVWTWWLGICWAAWAVLWFMYFLLLAAQQPIGKLAGVASVLVGIGTAWLPGFLVLDSVIGPGAALPGQ